MKTFDVIYEDGVIKLTSKEWGGVIYRIRKDKISPTILNGDRLDICSGIYILIGDKKIRVGKGDIYNRLSNHRSSKDTARDFFEYVIVVTGVPTGLSDTQQGIIEYTWINKLKTCKNYKITNDIMPVCPNNVCEHDKISTKEFMEKAEDFIRNMFNEEFFVNAINTLQPVSIIPVIDVSSKSKLGDLSKINNLIGKEFICKNSYCEAKGIYLGDGKIKVIKGSTIRLNNVISFSENYKRKRSELLFKNKIVNSIFQEDIEFDSLSTASSIILGNSSNGRKDWTYNSTSINNFL